MKYNIGDLIFYTSSFYQKEHAAGYITNIKEHIHKIKGYIIAIKWLDTQQEVLISLQDLDDWIKRGNAKHYPVK